MIRRIISEHTRNFRSVVPVQMPIDRKMSQQKVWEIIRFLGSGALNTGLTYTLFLILNQAYPSSLSYTLSYSVGIIIAYLLNTFLVFRSGHSKRMAAAVIASYLLQYFYGLTALNILVNMFALPAFLAMAVVIITAIPLQYLILRSAAAQALAAKIHEGIDND
ncbi:GtrA family protein [Mesorhizobium sp. B2-3-11]|uniref:GtrA family protein n=1 Tax=Mesorhizobium sp. B2-3-11 TaxID=2589953 RepID=UPI00112CBF01|nr:GtrA family protein [Mesorhizobium sp. B2-3-11]